MGFMLTYSELLNFTEVNFIKKFKILKAFEDYWPEWDVHMSTTYYYNANFWFKEFLELNYGDNWILLEWELDIFLCVS